MGGLAKSLSGLGDMSKGLGALDKVSKVASDVNNVSNLVNTGKQELGDLLTPPGEGQRGPGIGG